MSASSHSKGSLSPGRSQIPHTPMSERQQLALIKRLEEAATSSNENSNNNDGLLLSPPRQPLQVVNGSTPSTPLTLQQQKIADDLRKNGRITSSPAIERILRKISKRNSKGETPLHTAAIRGSPRLVRQLLLMGADPNSQDHAEWSPLHEACNRGNRAVVRVLLEFGADLNLKGFAKDSPLHDAARNGHLHVVKFLIKSGANLKARNSSNRTPLEEAEETLKHVDSEELVRTIKYLQWEEKRRLDSVDRKESIGVSDISDVDDDENESDSDEENGESENDVAKFLGVTKSSPDVQKAFRSLGLISRNSQLHDCLPNHRKRNFETMKQSSKQRLTYETANLKGETSPLASVENHDHLNRSRDVGLNAEPVDDQNPTTVQKRKSPESLEDHQQHEAKFKKRKKKLRQSLDESKTCESNESYPSADKSSLGPVDDNCVEQQELKVPPLKIILSQTNGPPKLQDAHSGQASDAQETDIEGWPSETSPPGREEEEVAAIKLDAVVASGPNTNSNHQHHHHKKRKLAAMMSIQSKENFSESSAHKKRDLPPNDIQKFLEIRKQVEQRRKNIFPVMPKPPEGYKDYLMNRKSYLLQGNSSERLRSMPKLEPPSCLEGTLRDLFVEQENERHKLRLHQLVEKEKLVLSVEQEILRVHGRAARALANQTLPYSYCTILKDEEIYNPLPTVEQEDKSKDQRSSRFNGRVFLSWLQDVDDKWEKIKEQMILRHHNEAESLNAVQKMNWEWAAGIPEGSGAVSDLVVPMVYVSEDFGFDLSRD